MNRTSPIPVRRLDLMIRPDPTRVLIRPFLFTPQSASQGSPQQERVKRIIGCILKLPEQRVEQLLEQVLLEFGDRHQQIRRFFQSRFDRLLPLFSDCRELSPSRALLIGSYFTSEYSLECAALFNPSIVRHPDQAGVPDGCVRIILSLRATGEGHISSITFRSGMVDGEGNVTVDAPSRFVTEPNVVPHALYDRPLFLRKLRELGVDNAFAREVVAELPESFTFERLHETLEARLSEVNDSDCERTASHMRYLAQANFEVAFDPDETISERVIYPISPSQSNGIEDARFVRFADDDGSVSYFATYTAFDGRVLLPQLIETDDFKSFRIFTLNGDAVANKGMALFPRRVNGQYCMLGRQDGENIHVMFSDHLHFWNDSRVIVTPSEAWEFVQLGNCGSPIETARGWLVLTHGVGPMRKYCIGAVLLDLEDPTRVIARLKEPLIKPIGHEREGYVPNVVYTCGAIVHNGLLVIPYGLSDSATTGAVVEVDALLDAMISET